MIAANEAEMTKSVYIDSEHVFLGLCKSEDLRNMKPHSAEGAKIDEKLWEDALAEVEELNDRFADVGFDPKLARRMLRRIIMDTQKETGRLSGHRSKKCKEVFETATKMAIDENSQYVMPLNFLDAVISQESEAFDRLFVEMSFNRERLLSKPQSSQGGNEQGDKSKTGTLVMEGEKKKDGKEKPGPKRRHSTTPMLDRYGRDVTKDAREGKIDPVIGRVEETKKLAQILVQKKKNNPVLVGEAGVGKTCIVEGLALKVVSPDAPSRVRDLRIVEISMGTLVAGTKYRGEFEERLQTLIKEASSDPNIVIFIDEIHTMVGAGEVSGGSLDAGNILKPALARGDIKCIGATTTAEYRKYIEKDPALERRFQTVWVEEPTVSEAIEILKGLKGKYEDYHGVKIPDKVVEKAVELSVRYIQDHRLPDKAIDIIDRACARLALRTLSPGDAGQTAAKELTVGDVMSVVSERARIPVDNISVDEGKRLLDMEKRLSMRVMGQEKAIREVAETIMTAKAGIRDTNKPLGVFLFAGSSGTGKTELAKAIAEFLFHDEKKLISFDMSEFQEKHSVSRLLGAPPGYVGYEEEGLLVSKVRTNPYSVILFDEIEKAHKDIFDVFLQIFQEGRLTDSHGRKANFSESIIIMTSNLGTMHRERNAIGINIGGKAVADGGNEYEARIMQAVRGAFKPEFLSRLQKTIVFYPLDKDTVRKIVVRMIGELNARLASKDIIVTLTDEAVEFLLMKGYSEAYGAREMRKTFDNYVSETLSKKILEGSVCQGSRVEVYTDEDGIGIR